jgi:hypothetical protein
MPEIWPQGIRIQGGNADLRPPAAGIFTQVQLHVSVIKREVCEENAYCIPGGKDYVMDTLC